MYNSLLVFSLTATLLVAHVTSNHELDDNLTGIQQQQEGDQDNDWISKTFDSIDPERFNQAAEIFGTVVGWLYGFAIVPIYGLIMTWHLRGGHAIPSSVVCNIPGDSLGGLLLCWTLKSFPAIVLVLLLVLGDFAKTVALQGLTFPVLIQKGPNDTALSLATEDRNTQRLPQTAGDPISLRSALFPDVFFEDDFERTDRYRSDQELIYGFMDAVDLVARGASPLTNSTLLDRVVKNTNYFGVNTTYATSRDLGPVVSIDMKIPLTCTDIAMTPVNQTQGQAENLRSYQSLVPDCTFSQVRQSGVYGGASDKVEIVEFASSEVDDRDKMFLSDGKVQFREFATNPEFRELARDKADWTRGRDVSSRIKGVQYGERYFSLKSAVLASGSQDIPRAYNVGNNVVFDPIKSYLVVGELARECPERPSGGSMEDGNGSTISCLAFLTLRCGTFAEDIASIKIEGRPVADFGSTYLKREDQTCSFDWFKIVWGRNFKVDNELVAVVAGVYGRVRPVEFGSGLESLNFGWHSIPAALLALSTLQSLPSMRLVVRPRINGMFIFFMLLPLVTAVMLLCAALLTAQEARADPRNCC